MYSVYLFWNMLNGIGDQPSLRVAIAAVFDLQGESLGAFIFEFGLGFST